MAGILVHGARCMKRLSLTPLHDVLLEIVTYIDGLCRDNGFIYFLAGGSALGAYRERGFVPWDDDLDIMLLWNEYESLLREIRQPGEDERFYLQEGGTDDWPVAMAKLRRNGTHYIEEANRGHDPHDGIFVDIWCLEPISDNWVFAGVQWLCGRVLVANALARRNYNPRGLIRTLGLAIAKMVPVRLLQGMLRVVRAKRGKVTRHVANFFHKGPMRTNVYDVSWFKEPIYLRFEGEYLPVPVGIESYLEKRFGKDFRRRPPAADRRAPHAKSYSVDEMS